MFAKNSWIQEMNNVGQGVLYRDRTEAGQELASHLLHYHDRDDLLVLALSRGGVPVAFEVARELGAPMDVFLVRKLCLPDEPQTVVGTVSSCGVRLLNEELMERLEVSTRLVDSLSETERSELERRESAYRGSRPRPQVKGKTVILVDDGLATGATMRAATAALRRQLPLRLVVAVPVSAPHMCDRTKMGADEMICAATPEPFAGVGQWYLDFSQISDEEVRELLETSELTLAHAAAEREELIGAIH